MGLGVAIEERLELGVACPGTVGKCIALQGKAWLSITWEKAGLTVVQQGAWLAVFLQGREGLQWNE